MDQLALDQTLPRSTNLSSKSGPTALRATVFFFLFPPIGVYFLWKDKNLHVLFATLTALLGFFNIMTAGSLYFSYDKIVTFSQQVGYEVPLNWDKYALILFFFSIYQTLSCLVLMREAKRTGYLNTVRLLYLVGMLLIDYIVVPLLLGAVLVDFFKAYLNKYQETLNETIVETY